jgi:hypothetical protein
LKVRGILDTTRLALLNDDSRNSDTFEAALRAATDALDDVSNAADGMERAHEAKGAK